jgi:hypothetical protein
MKPAAWDILMCSISTTDPRDPSYAFGNTSIPGPLFPAANAGSPSHLGNQHDEKVAAKLSLDAAYSKTEAQCNPPHDPRDRHCAHIAGHNWNGAAATCNLRCFFDSRSSFASPSRRAFLGPPPYR